jgi:hypothetical protein
MSKFSVSKECVVCGCVVVYEVVNVDEYMECMCEKCEMEDFVEYMKEFGELLEINGW